jgi:hypothetical protein
MGHTLMENRNGLIVAATMTTATGTAERKAAEEMIVRHSPGAGRITLGADKGYDAASFVADMRALNVTPHIAQNISGLGINILIGYFARNGVLDRTWGRSISRFSDDQTSSIRSCRPTACDARVSVRSVTNSFSGSSNRSSCQTEVFHGQGARSGFWSVH